MTTQTVIELIGYLGSALVLVSFLMASVVKLRVVNTVGSTIFAVYALIIRSYPTALMNFCLVCINLYYLWKLRNSAPNYSLLPLGPTERFVSWFLEEHKGDIAKCFPGRHWEQERQNRAWVVFHGEEPAGILLGREEEGVLEIALDYTTPAYRDSSVGRYLLDALSGGELRVLRYQRAEESHLAFLRKMGYSRKGEAWEREL